jgi:hypothetical protein
LKSRKGAIGGIESIVGVRCLIWGVELVENSVQCSREGV